MGLLRHSCALIRMVSSGAYGLSMREERSGSVGRRPQWGHRHGPLEARMRRITVQRHASAAVPVPSSACVHSVQAGAPWAASHGGDESSDSGRPAATAVPLRRHLRESSGTVAVCAPCSFSPNRAATLHARTCAHKHSNALFAVRRSRPPLAWRNDGRVQRRPGPRPTAKSPPAVRAEVPCTWQHTRPSHAMERAIHSACLWIACHPDPPPPHTDNPSHRNRRPRPRRPRPPDTHSTRRHRPGPSPLENAGAGAQLWRGRHDRPCVNRCQCASHASMCGSSSSSSCARPPPNAQRPSSHHRDHGDACRTRSVFFYLCWLCWQY